MMVLGKHRNSGAFKPETGTGSARSAQQRVSKILDDPSIEVFMAAAIAFRGVEAGKRWLTTPIAIFDIEAPLAQIHSAEGRKKILSELALIEHGMF